MVCSSKIGLSRFITNGDTFPKKGQAGTKTPLKMRLLRIKHKCRSGRVHKKKRVPITRDTATLLQAIGLTPAGRHTVQWPLFRYRRLLAQKHPEAPVIDTETILVFRRPETPVATPEHPLALMVRPNGVYGHPSSSLRWPRPI
jgi:hypothetical protein